MQLVSPGHSGSVILVYKIIIFNKLPDILAYRCRRLVRLVRMLVVVSMICPSQAATALHATAFGLHITTAGLVTQVQIDLTAVVPFEAVVSDVRNSVVVTAKDLEFSLPTGAGKSGKGLVDRIRYGKNSAGLSEIAIDTKSAVTIRKSYLAVAKHSKRVRMTIVLAQKRADLATMGTEPPSSSEVTGSLPSKDPTQPVTAADRKPLIVIDPGHGGIDPGAISTSGTKEKDVVLAFAKALQSTLQTQGHFDVALTRNDDTFLSLQARVDATRTKQADLFIAVHADTLSNHSVRGTTLYVLSEKASDAEAEALAQKENRADAIAGIDLRQQSSSIVDVLVNLAQRESNNRAAMFAEVAVKKLKPATTFTGKPLRSAGFVVLKAPDVPSVLVELGYLSNAQDQKNLTTEDWRNNMAKAFSAAISEHFSHNTSVTAQASP
jgi:N-acetylmuramoyl-L-alanine amidase